MRYIIGIALIISIVITLNTFTAINTERSVDLLEERINYLENELNKDESIDGEKVKNRMEEIKNNWDEINNILSLYIEHEELDLVEIELVTLNSYLKEENYTEAMVSIEKVKFQINHIKEKNSFKLKNVF